MMVMAPYDVDDVGIDVVDIGFDFGVDDAVDIDAVDNVDFVVVDDDVEWDLAHAIVPSDGMDWKMKVS